VDSDEDGAYLPSSVEDAVKARQAKRATQGNNGFLDEDNFIHSCTLEPTMTTSGKEPDPPTQHADSAPGNDCKTHQEGRPRTMIEERPASLINFNTRCDDERNRLRKLANSGNIMAKLIVETF
jgi:hypothetical protein